tara:strand:+ start:1593 stop:2897 length:1305 start_codon:yes stop_codon:yes gene_type:complete
MTDMTSKLMPVEDYGLQLERCARCSFCKWVPQPQVRNWRFAPVCPSIGKYNFHAYCAGGRVIMAFGLAKDQLSITDSFAEIVYKCQMCGACDVSCKTIMSGMLEPLDIMQALRIRLVEEGEGLPEHLPAIEGLRQEDNMLQRPKAERGNWAEGLDVKDLTKETAEVVYHAGCRLSFDEEMAAEARAGVSLLKAAGVDVGIMGMEEACCGVRAYEMGYLGELVKYAEHNKELFKKAEVKTVVTPCAECYQAFKVIYPKTGLEMDVEVLHMTEYLDRLIKQGDLKLTKKLPMRVTYHDPCHLCRLADPFVAWEGVETKVLGQLTITEPERPIRFGTKGTFSEPRNVLNSIPGVELVEMERTKEYAWCCGAGGGVIDAYPDFAHWTALERIEEAKTTGADALVTACPWCERNFNDAINGSGEGIKVQSIVELVLQAL